MRKLVGSSPIRGTKNNIMKDQLISFETDKLAKEKGCNLENCRCGGFQDCICYDKRITQSLLQKWLREKHNLYVYIVPVINDKKGSNSEFYLATSVFKFFEIKENKVQWNNKDILGKFQKYEEALEQGLQEALKLLKDTK